MEATQRDVQIYQTGDFKEPFSDWMASLRDRRVRNRIDARLGRLRLGNFGKCRALGDGVHELQIDCGPGYRVYFGVASNTVVLLLLGGDKDSQQKDIEKAKAFWLDYNA
jgi:putative addiction module killer protein